VTEVRLVDLAVIKRFSLAVRQEWADADDVLAALEDSRHAVLDALEADGEVVADPPPTKKRTSSARSRKA
jgi:hypothetical protein